MTIRPPRAKPAEWFEILKWAAMAGHALDLARTLAAGLELFPGQEAALASMPASVQEAVRSHWAPNSRYIPAEYRRYMAVIAKARAEGRLGVDPSEWAPPNRDPSLPPNRITTIVRPANAPHSSRIFNTIASEAGRSPATIRAWLHDLQDVLEAGDGVKRKAGRRRRPRGRRQAE
jgi:hypothetical protein